VEDEGRDRIEHEVAFRHAARGTGHSAAGERNRTPNAVDHYSLVLQIIQVVPVVTAFIVHAIADDRLANLLSWLLLLVGTGSVVWIERIKRRRAVRARPTRRSPDPAAEQPPPTVPPPVPVVTTHASEGGITISIQFGQPVRDRAATERRRARRAAMTRQRVRNNRPPDRG